MGAWANGASAKGADRPTTEATLTPVGYAQFTSLAAAVSLATPAAGITLADALAAGARLAVIIAETQAVRWRDDGSDPTGSVGMPLATGVQWTYPGNLSAIKFIEQTASAKLNVAYFK